jgi:excisionase family DNA binding protein
VQEISEERVETPERQGNGGNPRLEALDAILLDLSGRHLRNPERREMRLEKHYRLDEVASLLGVGRSTLRKWIARGQLRAIHLTRGCVRVPESAVLELLGITVKKRGRPAKRRSHQTAGPP